MIFNDTETLSNPDDEMRYQLLGIKCGGYANSGLLTGLINRDLWGVLNCP